MLLGVGMGIATGAGLGAAFDNIGVGVAIGAGLGSSFGIIFGSRRSR